LGYVATIFEENVEKLRLLGRQFTLFRCLLGQKVHNSGRFLFGRGASRGYDDLSGRNRAYFAYHLDNTDAAVTLVEVRTLDIGELCAFVGAVKPTGEYHSCEHSCFPRSEEG
jgi:hypothetical protein